MVSGLSLNCAPYLHRPASEQKLSSVYVHIVPTALPSDTVGETLITCANQRLAGGSVYRPQIQIQSPHAELNPLARRFGAAYRLGYADVKNGVE